MSAPTSTHSDDVAIININGGDDEEADVTFEFNGKNICLAVSASSSDLSSSQHESKHVEDHLIYLLNQTFEVPFDEYDGLTDKILGLILDVGRPSFAEAMAKRDAFQATSPSHGSDHSLHSYLYPETLYFRLKTVDGKPTVFPIPQGEVTSVSSMGDNLPFYEMDDQLPRYSSKELEIQELLLHGNGTAGRVCIDGRDMLCKSQKSGLYDPGLERELTSLEEIRRALRSEQVGQGAGSDTSTQVCIPKLLGYVIHAESGTVVGLLREWISTGNLGHTMSDVDLTTVATDVKKRWATQIESTLSWLHNHGITWGDGKPSNVIIDANNDAWLIDFGGGWSEGWVDEEYTGTVHGDQQAFEKIIKFLGL